MVEGGRDPQRRGICSLSAVAFILFSTELAGRMAVQLMLKEQGAPLFLVSMSTTMCWFGTLVGGVMWGRFADTYRSQWLMLAVVAGATLSIGILAVGIPASAVLVMSFARLFAVSGNTPISMTMISRKSSLKRRGRDLSGLSSSRSIGATLGLLVGGILIGRVGFSGTFIALTAWSSLALVITLLARHAWEQQEKPVAPPRLPPFRTSVHRLLGATVLRQTAIVGTSSLIYVYMQELSIRSDWMGGISGLNPAMQFLGLLLFGQMADRIGRRHVFLLGFLLSVAAPTIYAFASNTALLAIGFIVHGIGFGALYIGSASYIGDVTPSRLQGRMFGLYEASFAVGGVIGPILSGAIATYLGLRPMLWTMAAIAACSAALAYTQATPARKALDDAL